MKSSALHKPVVLLSFDAEEFDIPLEYGHRISEPEQFRIGADGFERTLLLLRQLSVTATFFTTAALAQHRPDLVRWAVRDGHEIASHAFYHSRFEAAHLRSSRETLERLSGTSVVGFRMPRMAPVRADQLREAGYVYDSSMNPIWLPGRYNRFFAPRKPRRRDGILEIPLSAVPFIRWPLFWLAFKNQPRWLTRASTAAVLSGDGHAALYFHPWELMENHSYGLPRLVASRSGQSMTRALAEHLLWLRDRAEFRTYASFAAGFGGV
ncbi:MAG: polysaccharide deacetylase family protein [Phycisphaerales bacterium]|nr:polysaccharide deacetylase family protein [Planctomycetota bacterium]